MTKQIEIVSLDRVFFKYPQGKLVLQDLSYKFYAGAFYFITGNSGVGKTTLLKLLYAKIKANRGSLKVFGKDVSTLPQREVPLFRQKMGLIFQECLLLNHLNVVDNVALALKISGTPLKQAREYAMELLHWIGLDGHFEDFPPMISDGQKQRVAIARALVTRPLLLLADEPTGNVDENNAFKLLYLFEELNKVGTTVIFATHNKTLMHDFPHHELVLESGQLKENIKGSKRIA